MLAASREESSGGRGGSAEPGESSSDQDRSREEARPCVERAQCT